MLTAASGEGDTRQSLQHGALARALVPDDSDGGQGQVLLHAQGPQGVDEVDAGPHLLLVLAAQVVLGPLGKAESRECCHDLQVLLHQRRTTSTGLIYRLWGYQKREWERKEKRN